MKVTVVDIIEKVMDSQQMDSTTRLKVLDDSDKKDFEKTIEIKELVINPYSNELCIIINGR